MKTLKILTITTSMLAGSVLFAQDATTTTTVDDDRDNLRIGIKGGVNYSNLYDTKGQDFAATSLWGFVGGGYLSIPIGTYLGVQPEVLFSQKGYSGQGTEIDGGYSYTDRMDFLDVPIMLQFKPIPNLYILGGPEYSYLMSRTYTFTQNVTSQTTQQDFNNDNIRHNIFGLIFGLDINFDHFTVGGRIAWDEQDNNGDGTSSLPRYRNIWGQLTLGIRL
jgi:Outer membrane protein beta-barrel domain